MDCKLQAAVAVGLDSALKRDVMMTSFVFKNKMLEIPLKKSRFSLPWVLAVEYFCIARCSFPGAGSVCAQGGMMGSRAVVGLRDQQHLAQEWPRCFLFAPLA